MKRKIGIGIIVIFIVIAVVYVSSRNVAVEVNIAEVIRGNISEYVE